MRQSLLWTLGLIGILLTGFLLPLKETLHAAPPAQPAISAVDVAPTEEDVAPAAKPDVPAGQDDAGEIKEAAITDSDREHWAFMPPQAVGLPAVKHGTWIRQPLDAFILAQLEQVGLPPAPEANRETLLRRVTFDLTGLPPTLEELAAFEQDQAPGSYERVVDRLLASPAYGERWAQHWLDLARFADTDGFEHDKVRPEAWKYRDWVISSLNDDLPYNRFVELQIAGDELGGPEQAVATMFCLSGPDMPDINDQHERRHSLLNELTGTVGSVFLGLQLACAECHDHKYDPLSQADFYRLRAVFENSIPDLKRDAGVFHLQTQKQPTVARLWIRGDHRRPGPVIAAGFPRVADLQGQPLPQDVSPRVALARWLVDEANPLTARVLVNRVWQHHFGRGLFSTSSDVGVMNAGPSHPELLDWLTLEFCRQGWSLKHLHRLIVTSATYRQSSRSTPDDAQWARRLELDPDCELLSRYPRRRLDGETLRDTLLSVAGLLNNERGGPGVMPPLPEELVQSLLKGQWKTSPRKADHYRRSIYLFARRNLRYPLFEAFGRPDANASCAVRHRSTIATQGLLFLNGELVLQSARNLAGLTWNSSPERNEQVRQLYRRIYTRSPTAEEIAEVISFWDEQTRHLMSEQRPVGELALPVGIDVAADPYAAAAWTDIALALLNTGEFIYTD